MKIAVMGSGAVGGYFGARLAAHGEDVGFIARGEHLLAIRQHGLRVRGHDGELHIKPARATDNPVDIGPVDMVMFCVKMWDTERAGEMVRPMLGPGTGVVSFQNGVDNEEKLAAILGGHHVLGGVAYVMSIIAAPGVIQQSGGLGRLVFGELGGETTHRAEAFLGACQGAGIDVELSADIQKALWTKFVFIGAVSGVTALTRSSLGSILGDLDTRELLAACMREVEAVGRARGVNLDPGIAESQLAFASGLPPGFTTSMQQDLERGNRLELDFLNGTVARLGRHLGVPTPVNSFIHAALTLHASGVA